MESVVGRLRNELLRFFPPRVRTGLRLGFGVPLAKAGLWRVRCPICGWRFREFLPFGTPPQPNVQCPRCGAFDRHRLLFLYLKERTSLFTDRLRILHFAPEASLARIFRSAPNLEYVTSDLSTSGVALRADITRLPFPDATFDVVLCSHVHEHVDDDRAAIGELYRVLAPGGWALILVPIDLVRETTYEDPTIVDPQEREIHFGQGDHVRVYGRDFTRRLQSAGFTVATHHYAATLPEGRVRRHGLRDEPLYLCVKEVLP